PASAGALTYTPPTGTTLDAGANQALTVNVAATSDYNAASKTVFINVNKADQAITWSNPADITYATALSGTQLNATVSVVGSGAAGAISYSPPAGTVLRAGASQAVVG